MKKVLLTLTALCLFVGVALAQSRGPLQGVYSRWYNASVTQTTITLPYNSRDVYINNGSSTIICATFSSNTILSDCDVTDEIFQIDAGDDIYLQDFVTGTIKFRTIVGTASPITVVVTY